MSLQSWIATLAGDLWISSKCLALWPWPAIVRNYPQSKFTGIDYRRLTNIIKPGDMLLVRSDLYKISNRGIPERLTFLKHLAVYVGQVDGFLENEFIKHPILHNNGKFKRSIVHAISEGVVCQDIYELLKHIDYCAIVRPWANPEQQAQIVDKAMSLVGKKYDFKFAANNKQYYCTEVGAQCLKDLPIKPTTIKVNTSIIGYIIPLDKFKHDVYVADAFLWIYPIVFINHCLENNTKARKHYKVILPITPVGT